MFDMFFNGLPHGQGVLMVEVAHTMACPNDDPLSQPKLVEKDAPVSINSLIVDLHLVKFATSQELKPMADPYGDPPIPPNRN